MYAAGLMWVSDGIDVDIIDIRHDVGSFSASIRLMCEEHSRVQGPSVQE